MHKFSNTSKIRLSTCHDDLQLIFNTAIRVSDVDFGIAEGYRDIKIQNKYFKEGKSKIDGITRKGKHNYMPSLAVDIYISLNGKASWDEEHLSYLAGLVHGISQILYEMGRTSHIIRWGGNFDIDGELLEQSFDDRPHFELIKGS